MKTKEQVLLDGKTELYEDDLIYGIKEPRSSCKYCNGTGRIGWDTGGTPVTCRCLYRKGKGQWISAIAFKIICETRRPDESEGSNDYSGSSEVHTSDSESESEAEEVHK